MGNNIYINREKWCQDDFLFINPSLAIKNDIKNITLYDLTPNQLSYFKLPWIASILIQIINGKRKYKDIIRIFGEIFGSDEESEVTKIVNATCSYMNANKKIIMNSPIEMAPPEYQKEDYFIPLEEYSCNGRRTFTPLQVTFVLTNKCSTNCIYCYADRSKEINSIELSTKRWLELIDELADLGLKKIEVTGGDPFIKKDILIIYEQLIKKRFLFFTSTKCYISENEAKKLVDIGFNDPIGPFHRSFQISVDSAIPEVAAFLTRKANYLQDAQLSVKNLLNQGIKPTIKCVLTSYNYNHIESLVNVFFDMGVTEFHFVQYGRSNYCHDNKLFLSIEQKKEATDIYNKIISCRSDIEITFQNDLGLNDYRDVRLSQEAWNNRSRCTGGFCSICILPDGNTILCEQIPHREEYYMGSVKSNSILDVWNNGKINTFLFSDKICFKESVCFSCSDFESCHYSIGYCYRDSLVHYGTLFDAPPSCPKQTKHAKRMI